MLTSSECLIVCFMIVNDCRVEMRAHESSKPQPILWCDQIGELRSLSSSHIALGHPQEKAYPPQPTNPSCSRFGPGLGIWSAEDLARVTVEVLAQRVAETYPARQEEHDCCCYWFGFWFANVGVGFVSTRSVSAVPSDIV